MRILLLILTLSFALAYASIGTISSVRGEVDITTNGTTKKGTIGTLLEKGDLVKTGRRAKLQVILDDKTVITIGRNSEFEVEQYFFEKGNKESNVKLNYKEGFFKTITGQIGKIAPKEFKIKTKNSTIGIRGTQLLTQIDTAKGIETTACTVGAITVTADMSGATVDVKANQMVSVSTSSGMGKVEKFTAKAQAQMKAGFKGDKKEEKKKESADKKETKAADKKEEKKKESSGKKESKAADKKESKATSSETKKESANEDKKEVATEKAQEETTTEDQDNAENDAPVDEDVVAEEPTEEAPIVDDTPLLEDSSIMSDTNELSDSIANDVSQAITDEITESIVQDVATAIEASDPISTTTFEVPVETTTTTVPEFSPF